jgi:plastocyanin
MFFRQALVLITAGSLGLGCGSSGEATGAASPSATPPIKFTSSDAPVQPAGSIEVVMKDMKYSPKSISVPAGRVVFYLVNAEAAPCGWPDCRHDMVITTQDKKTIAYSDNVEIGKTKVFTIEAMPSGTYSFHDDIGMHLVELNMAGTLDVS